MLASALSNYMGPFALERKLGMVVAEMLFVLDASEKCQRRPDVAFVSYPRWPERTVARTNAWNVVPDLAVEVVSPTNLAEEIDAKLTDYFAAGVRLVWVIYPDSGRVYVYDSPDRCRVLERSDELDGGEVLPGFRLPIETLFQAATKPD
jgi:Uma2 family endonuclease